MNNEARDFDKEAARWDERPSRVKLADDVTGTMLQQLTLTPEMEVLDFGCGTGLVTLRIAPLVKMITGADSSQGMLNVLEEKAARQNLSNVRTMKLDPDSEASLSSRYDLIISSMTLHHVERIESLLKQLYRAIKPSGVLCIADLDPDQGLFHENNAGVFHSGFDRANLRQSFTQAGFISIKEITAAEVEKPTPSGEARRFSVFLITGRKM